jgi:tight adherence protein B
MNDIVQKLADAGIDVPVVISILVAIVVLLIAGMALSARATIAKERQRRLSRVQPRSVAVLEAAKVSVVRNTSYSSVAIFDLLIRRLLPQPERLRARLGKTGKNISLGQYLGACSALFVLVGLATIVLGLSVPAALLIGVAAGLGLPYFVIGYMGARRVAKFVDLFPEAIDLIVRGLKSGLPIGESIKSVGREISDPVGEEFRLISDSLKFGLSITESLTAALPRIDSPEFRFFLISLSIQQETGGNLAETLENLGTVIRRRRQMRLKIKAYSSEAKASAYIIGSLPFLMFGLILVANYDYESQLFTDPRGVVQIIFGLCSYAIGISVMAKMVRFEI